jgi:hypothetical protein
MVAMKAAGAAMEGESLWPRLAEPGLVIEACEYERLHAVLAHEFERITTHLRLVGAGVGALGEDVSVHVENGSSLHETQPALPLEGEWSAPARHRFPLGGVDARHYSCRTARIVGMPSAVVIGRSVGASHLHDARAGASALPAIASR